MSRKRPSTPAPAPEPPANPWPAALAKLRASWGKLSQKEAAKKVRVTLRAWSGWERGEYLPSPAHQLLLELLIEREESQEN